MANRAIRLVRGGGIEVFPIAQIGARTAGVVNDLPEIDPLLCNDVVLNRKYFDLTVRKLRRIGLLPLRANRVVDWIIVPTAIGLSDGETVTAVAHNHLRIRCSILSGNNFQFAAAVDFVVAQEELVVLFEVAGDIFRGVGTKHFRHAASRPRPINPAMARFARFGTRVF